ncbi:MAG TPA: hypothetical protein VHH73_20890 [Verrucomicrobiae bacterium]|jgi:hypothetical protein|nr:hypothetical protein [Verrucomicrobiae bacterium]
MKALNDREKRTVRLATIGISVYLVLFFGMRVWKALDGRRASYQQMVRDAELAKAEILPYEARAIGLKKLMDDFHLDPSRLTRATVVAEASAAIQKAAVSGGIQVGPVRETPGQSTGKDVATIQLEGAGPIPAVMAFLHRFESLGYPLVLETISLNSDPRPGMIKMSVTITILDFEQWKKTGVSRV